MPHSRRESARFPRHFRSIGEILWPTRASNCTEGLQNGHRFVLLDTRRPAAVAYRESQGMVQWKSPAFTLINCVGSMNLRSAFWTSSGDAVSMSCSNWASQV
jgi:hypothetical protein